MSHRELDELERAAWLHDIGRLAIPDPAITTANALDGTIERRRGDQVKAVHTMTRGTPFLHPAADLVVASREYFDGSGQPNGLMGSNDSSRRESAARRRRVRRPVIVVPGDGRSRSSPSTGSWCAGRGRGSIPKSSTPGCVVPPARRRR